MCFDNDHRHLFSRTRKTQVNPVDAIQGNAALSIAESIALWERLDELRNTPLPPRPERVPDYVRDAQEILRPAPEIDRPLRDRYQDERRIDRDPDRWDFRGRYGY